ncbi:MAG TPA: hypothetical protein VF185_01085 [Patescibacteria group bacterium]
MKRGIKTPAGVTLAIITLITIFFWIAFEVYRTLTIKPSPPVPAEIVAPLNPTLDVAALNKLQQRMYLSDDQIGNNTVTASTLPTPTPVATPVASESATPIASQSATPGGTTP